MRNGIIWRSIFIAIVLLVNATWADGQQLRKEHFSIGETITFRSEVLDEYRIVNIYLPANYHNDTLKQYQVIYLLDGSADEDFIHISGLVQFCTFSWIRMMPESIVVGIANVDRQRDFTYPSGEEMDRIKLPTSGGSKAFIEFLTRELPAVIQQNYRVNGEKTLIGQSLGGLLASEVLFKNPESFNRYIIISPSLWWDAEKLLQLTLQPKLQNQSVYIGVGQEGPVMERLAQTLFYKLSLEKPQLQLFFQYFPAQNHGDILHLAAYDAFAKLFKTEDPGRE
ncbi:MAG: alpha/beta hydrolase [Saprospiraceae bacterium]|nr:alpha/beta hydrolase [Saprospiraceae bacterium]MCB9318257.1 alpha/beta hydrolase [Lewinellaceae bacterium]